MGRAGAGKTTFARLLGEITGAPVIVLDAIWQPQWTEADLQEFRSLIKEAHACESWISDGNFAVATFDIRLPRATLILWLDGSKLLCTWRATKRVFKRGEPHRMNALIKVLKFIWKFDKENRPLIEANRMYYGPEVQVIRLNSNRDIDAFLATLGASRPFAR